MRNQKHKKRTRKNKKRERIGSELGEAVQMDDRSEKVVADNTHHSSAVADSATFTEVESKMLGFIRKDVLLAVIVAALLIAGLIYGAIAWGSGEFLANAAENLAKASGLIE